MKRISFVLVLCALMAVSAPSNPTTDGKAYLSSWAAGAAGTAHQCWDFTGGRVNQVATEWITSPQKVIGSDPTEVGATISAEGWGASGKFWRSCDIPADSQIANYEKPGSYKETWIDFGVSAGPTSIVPPGASSTVADFDCYLLDGQGHAGFSVKIVPTPSVETIELTIPGDVFEDAWLDCIHTDTICHIPTPAPGAILLGSIGIGLVGWLRRRKTL